MTWLQFPGQNINYDTGLKDLFTQPKNANLFIHSSDIIIFKLIKILSIMCDDFSKLKYFINELIRNNSDDYDFSLENNISILNNFFLIEKIILNYDDPTNIYFSTETQVSSRYLTRPKVYVFSHMLEIGLIWSPLNKYDEKIRFFEGEKLILETETIISLRKKIKLNDIFITFSLIFLEKSTLHNSLGMTGN